VRPDQFIGKTLYDTTAISDIVGTRVYHGLRPKGTTLPAINYFMLGGGTRENGIETQVYTINCRATDPGTARNLAREVVDLFAGTSGTAIYGTINGFDVSRAVLRADQGLIPEPDDETYNAPVDIQIIFPSSTVS